MILAKIRVKGVVQGVGFRPFIYNLATSLELRGFVLNDSEGVYIEIEANSKAKIDNFKEKIYLKAPKLAEIESIELELETQKPKFSNFQIRESRNLDIKDVAIPLDSAICPKCLSELKNQKNRRYNYPFINCIECGVRYSIIENMPYDRERTSMREFEMCSECESEYSEPLDRRFHAQPISCPNCGPKLKLFNSNLESFENLTQFETIERVVRELKEGSIVAIKGYGGFNLISKIEQVEKMRERKKRKKKPFALMFKDLKTLKRYAKPTLEEERVLSSKEAPILLLPKLNQKLDSVAPNIDRVGCYLAYSPLHYLILREFDEPLISTSANISSNPIIRDIQSFKELKIADYILDFNREILNPSDDSILSYVGDRFLKLRDARGYSPKSFKLPKKVKKNILAVGSNQKSSIAIAFEDRVIKSPYIGDLNSIQTLEYFKDMIETLKRVYNFRAEVVVCDKHSRYESSKFAKSLNLETIEIQHHFAHTLSVVGEHKIESKVLSFVFDGTGFGDDGNLWGGEVFIADKRGFERIYHFDYFKLLGGEVAIKNPERILASLAFDIGKEEILRDFMSDSKIKTLKQIYLKNLNSPLTSSVGRIFDLIAYLLKLIDRVSFDGESGVKLESLYQDSISDSYNFRLNQNIIEFKESLSQMVDDSKEPKLLFSKFINSLIEVILKISKEYPNYPIVLSGGVFQNRALMEQIIFKFKELNLEFYLNERVPLNDEGISFGQIFGAIEC